MERVFGIFINLLPVCLLTGCLNGSIRGVERAAVDFESAWECDQGPDYRGGSSVELWGGTCRLKPTDQADDDGSAGGYGGGTLEGVAWDGSVGALRLDQASATNVSSLDSSWAPQWGNLKFHWKMDGSGPVSTTPFSPDQGIGSCNAWLGSPTYVSGQVGTAVDFGPNGFAQCPGAAHRSIANNLTLSFWIRASGTLQAWQGVASAKDSTLTPPIGWSVANDNGNSLYLIVDTSAQTNAACGIGKVPALDGAWHHVVFTASSGTVNSYLDGRWVDTCSYAHGGGFAAPASIPDFANVVSSGSSVVDEFAAWDTVLTATEIEQIFARQSARYSGQLTSRVMDAYSAGQNWTTFSWLTSLPFLKELPDFGAGPVQNETSASYPQLVGSTGSTGDDNLMSGIVGLWHFNESAATGGAGNDFADDSGSGFAGEAVGGAAFGAAGLMNNGLSLDGTAGYATFGDRFDFAGTAPFSVSLWYRTNTDSGAPVLVAKYQHDGTFWQGWLAYLSPGNICFARTLNGGGSTACINTSTADGRWHHWVGVYDGTSIRAYLDGVPSSPVADTNSILNHAGNFQIGFNSTGSYFSGVLDEAAVWSRALHPGEVAQLYRRGANRVKIQVRTCTAPDCTDDPTGGNWRGPDGTSQTYFSELNNNTIPLDASGDVRAATPSLALGGFTNPIGPARYFQYRAILESDALGAGCDYGAGPTWCSPEIRSTQVDPVHYDPAAPAITGKAAIPFRALKEITETLGSACAGGVTYNVGVGNDVSSSTWYWWDPVAGDWRPADGTAGQATVAASASSHLPELGKKIGRGNLFFKAYLKSDGLSPCELDRLGLKGMN